VGLRCNQDRMWQRRRYREDKNHPLQEDQRTIPLGKAKIVYIETKDLSRPFFGAFAGQLHLGWKSKPRSRSWGRFPAGT
jgi:hypothetical protein